MAQQEYEKLLKPETLTELWEVGSMLTEWLNDYRTPESLVALSKRLARLARHIREDLNA